MAEANRMKTEFISVVSHQLRSPLSNLGWSMDYLLSRKAGKITKGQEEYFQILKENTGRMKRLVADLLVVSRIENATMPLNKQTFSLAEKTKGIINECSPLAQAANVKIKFKNKKDGFKVRADPDQIENAIANLLDNAIRYVREKGEIKIEVYRKGRRVYFSVTDSGVGIPEEEQARIFQKFFRASNVMKRQTEGSGLGLFIAKSAVERSGGKIYFKSQLGKGTTFWFYLPAV
jgi:signal transduction histidine kinase